MERRSYYRINDVVSLQYQVLNQDEQSAARVGVMPELAIGEMLEQIDRDLNRTINLLWAQDPLLGQALGLLNRKLSVIAAQSLSAETTSPSSYEKMLVNVSGCGIAFETAEHLEAGTRLQVCLLFHPSGSQLNLMGTVVTASRASGADAANYWTRVSFDEDQQAQETLIQHVVQRQAGLVREQ